MQHTLIVADLSNLIEAPTIVGPRRTTPFLYRGTGLIADKENPLVLEVLTASSTTYSYKSDAPVLVKVIRNLVQRCY
jgi:oligosaccharyltransferase complex subunit beta